MRKGGLLSNLILGDADPDVLLLWQLIGEDAVAKAELQVAGMN